METFYANTNIGKGKLLIIDDLNEVVHAFASLRIKSGETVDVINGRGERYRTEVVKCTNKSLSLMPLEKISEDTEYSELKLTLAISLLNKNSKMKLLMEKLTELGISELIPFVSERTAFPKMKTESLRPSMISALKQCGGSMDIKISETLIFSDLLKKNDYAAKYFSDITGESLTAGRIDKNILAVVGPEGGFTDNEKEELMKAGFKPIKLNKRVLRAETAAIITASKFLY